ncbi:hypothetical protein M378DRAFT_171977 [Amanita muscaria Koide BX008]|uniref:Uncharacterized protein n=1 Tax=Amanita muscaria (strain Koide BX008) TaxID=946122 RepID=A0A0C2S3J6_AMAMK|nr:hypothetical protein M378DRAFT_171977 [Amanita muscaria Koide BX008]
MPPVTDSITEPSVSFIRAFWVSAPASASTCAGTSRHNVRSGLCSSRNLRTRFCPKLRSHDGQQSME